MIGVAFGHWLAADVRVVNGKLSGGNALDQLTSLHLLTWLFQVMPLFFCIGGFSNAASLDAHWRTGKTSSAWVQSRLMRLVGPSSLLAGFWFVAVVGALAIPAATTTVTLAAGVAAIPLWFLANYVVDTAVAPITLRLFRTHRVTFVSALAITFLSLEACRFFGVRYLPQANIVLGWMCFQVLGFAWRDGLLPSGRRLVGLGTGLLIAAIALVAIGPWPTSMVSVPGAQFANTWPPSLALLVFGFGYCSLAIAAAPSLSRHLSNAPRTWTAVVAANTVTMTSYLWHFTALIAAAGAALGLGLLPTSAVGSANWWMHKALMITMSAAVLVGVLLTVGRKETSALQSGASNQPSARDNVAVTALLALTLAAGFEIWTAAHGHLASIGAGTGLVLTVRYCLRR